MIRASGAAVIWCPSSNRFLYGATAPRALLAPGTDVLLGTDSLLSGDGTLFDELRCARELGHLSDTRLLDAVGSLAARRLGIDEPSLMEGARADLIVLRRSPFDATADDVALVVAGGVVRVADPSVVAGTPWGVVGDSVSSMGTVRRIYSDPATRPEGAS